MSTLFTQKHYEHLIDELHRNQELEEDQKMIVADFLCGVFGRDNPKFKPIKFLVDVKNAPLPRRAS